MNSIELTASVLSKEILKEIENDTHGILLKNLPNYDYNILVQNILSHEDKTPLIFFVGFNVEEVFELRNSLEQEHLDDIAFTVEEAEKARHDVNINRTKVVIVRRHIPKLSSLNWYKQITTDQIYNALCEMALDSFNDTNESIKNLWRVIKTKSIKNIISFEQLVQYYCSVLKFDKLTESMMNEIYSLGLIPDQTLLDSPKREVIRKKILDNYSVVQRIRYLEESDLKILQTSTKNNIPAVLLNYFKSRDPNLLSNLKLHEVSNLLKQVSTTKRKDTNTNENDNENGNRHSHSPNSLGVDLILDNDEKEISDIIEKLDEELKEDSDKKKSLTIKTEGGIQTKVELSTEVSNMLNAFIGEDTHGGVILTEETNAPNALSNIDSAKVNLFNEDYINEIKDKLHSFSEEFPEEANNILSNFTTLLEMRKELVQFKTKLSIVPMLNVIDMFNKNDFLIEYLNQYNELITKLKNSYLKFATYSPVGAKELIAQINSIDTIFVLSKENKTHAILTPLNPLYLWKYIELAKRIKDEKDNFSDLDRTYLIKTSEEIPNPLNTVFVSTFITNNKDEVIAEMGKLGNLPIYSNDYYVKQSTDGLKTIQSSVMKFLSVYPHSSIGLRVAFIDPPSVKDTLNIFKDMILKVQLVGLQIDIYKTKESPYFWGDTEDVDEDYIKVFRDSDNFSLNVQSETKNLKKVLGQIKKKPYHIISVFDPSIKTISEVRTENKSNLKVHPLCIPKMFSYDPITDMLEILPTNQGDIFTVYNDLVAKLNDKPKGWQNTVVSNLEPVKEELQELMGNTEWFIIADANLKNFEISTIGSKNCIFYNSSSNREIGIYTLRIDKLVKGLDSIVRNIGNYIPKDECIERLINQVKSLDEKNLMNIISNSNSRVFDDNHAKGSLGLAISASWYRDKFPDSLLASLDEDLARTWLKDREEKITSDLIGIRKGENSEAVIDIIEVKTFKDFTISNNENLDGTQEIHGHAVDQVNTINKLIKEIILKQNKLTSVSRRELLRYQVYKTLFNMDLSKKEKKSWTDFLNDLFSNKLESIKVNNKIYYVNFNNNSSTIEHGVKYTSDDDIILCELNNDVIEKYVSSCYDSETELKLDDENRDVVNKTKDWEPEGDNKKNTSSPEETIEDSSEDLDVRKENNLKESEVPVTIINNENEQEKKSSANFIKEFIEEKAKGIYQALKDYSIDVQEVDPNKALVASRFVRFRVKLRPGENLRKVQKVQSDIAREIEAINEIFVDNERGTNYIYMDVPRDESETVYLLDHLNTIERGNIGDLKVILGQEPTGKMEYLNIAKAPHLLTAGTTGSGKTIFLYSIILSLISQFNDNELELVIIDPKQTDFIYFEDLPHLRNGGVIIEPENAVEVLNELVNVELQRRTELLRESKSRDLQSYNEKNSEHPLKPILVIVDEYADLVAVADMEGTKTQFENNMVRLAQRSRNVGIHLVIATQRPSADIVTSRLKANMPTRISFWLPANQDSRTILDATGAEDLLGKGDMLYSNNGIIQRLQGLYVGEDELQNYLEIKYSNN
ncbi:MULTISPECIES: FtsK/SpoIIIE domain-containing protein [Bhargavaea]|uniref:FtsK/SpoIIIE domain-containing protein n=1 Tax=Bhargavaea changchunensis TaxID=2134037 RepID=A0ABW2NJQ5_9BACL|nr:FtsK/SpoIIIE domain-containing protein [Bhargavaea sp. CC-171006]